MNESIGDILRNKRKELGYSLDDAADATNIRRRVLETFETGDFAYFPPDGYARNMILSYARFLNMNVDDVSRTYDIQRNEFESRNTPEFAASNDIERMKRRANAANDRAAKAEGKEQEEQDSSKQMASSIKVIPRSSRNATSYSRRAGRQIASDFQTDSFSPVEFANDSSRQKTNRHRRHISASDLHAADNYSNSSSRSSRLSKSESTDRNRRFNSRSAAQTTTEKDPYTTGRLSDITAGFHKVDFNKESESAQVEQDFEESSNYELRERNRKTKPTARGSRSNSSSSIPHNHDVVVQGPVHRIINAIISIFKDRRTRLIAIAVIFIVLAIVVAASLLISSASNNENSNDVIEVQGGAEGDSSTSTTSDEAGNTTATVTTANGNPVVITLEVEEGKTSLINVTYDDDIAYNGTAVGPWKREFNVTKSFNASFGTPDSVKVTENGKEIAITSNEDGTGTLTVNIQAAGLAESSK